MYTAHKKKIFPRLLVKNVGETAKFFCTNSSEHNWSFDDSIKDPEIMNASSSNSWVTIKNLEMKHSGRYSCFGKDTDGYYFYDEALLVVNSKQYYKIHKNL